MKVEAILFDLGKVLVDFNFEIAISRMMNSCTVSRAEFEAVLWDRTWLRGYERGEISTEQFHQYLCDAGKLNVELPRFREVWSSIFLPDLIVSEDLLAALKRNYPLILVSNTNQAHADFIREKYTVFSHFDHLIFSHEVGSLKPDRKIYESAVKASGKMPASLFFVDDREENVVAARELGIRAHQFTSPSRLVDALHEAGVDLGGYSVPS